jgi:hypothetical protein
VGPMAVREEARLSPRVRRVVLDQVGSAALVPAMTYDGMEVAHGGEAGLAWEQLVRGGFYPTERQRLKNALFAYCRQNTLAMAKILERLRAGTLGPSKV